MHPNAHDTTTTNDASTGKASAARSKGRKLSIAGATTALALVATGFGYQQMNDDTVTLSLDGKTQQVDTNADTVGQLLTEAGVELGERDVVAPAADTEVEDGQRIAVRFARPLTVNLDGEKSKHWVTATDVNSALDQIGVRAAGAELSVSRGAAIDRNGMAVTVGTPKQVKLVYGGMKPVTRTVTAITVKDALADQKLAVDSNDVVKPAPGTTLDDGDKIVVTKVNVKERRNRNEVIPNKTETVRDGSMYKGQTKVTRKGRDGSRDVVYELRFVNNKLADSKVARVGKRVAPVNRVVKVGVKEKPAPRPAPARAPAPSRSSASAPAANYASGGTVWDQLAKCESGGNWAINTGNGYYGGLQFNLGTWRAMGGPGMPHQQSRETQIAIAEKLRATNGGYGAWPACSSKLGLPR